MSSPGINIAITAETAPISRALQETTESTTGLSDALKASGTAGEAAGSQIAAGFDQASFSIREAREASRLASEEFGIHIPRALSQIAARSETLGPLLAGAFSGFALIGFAEVASTVATKLSDLMDDTFVYTQTEKAADAATKDLNDVLLDQGKKLDAAKTALDNYGKSASEIERARILADARDNVAAITEGLNKANGELSQAKGWWGDIKDYVVEGAAAMGNQVALGLLLDDAATRAAALKNNQTQADKAAADAGEALFNQIQLQNEEDADAAVAAWQKKLKAAQEYYDRIQKLVHDQMKAARPGPDPYAAAIEQATAQQTIQLATSEKLTESTVERDTGQLQLNTAVAAAAVSQQQILIAEDKASGLVAKEKADRVALVGLIEQERDAKLAAIDDEIAAKKSLADTLGAAGDTTGQNAAIAAYTTLEAKKVEITAAANAAIAASNDQTTRQETTALDRYLTKFNAEFATNVTAVVQGHETMGQAASKMYQQMTAQMLSYLVTKAAKEAEGFLITEAFKSAELAHFLTALGIQKSTGGAANAATATSNAAVAATGAAAAEAAIPIVGPGLAEAAAAAMMGSMGGYIGLASFQVGGIVPETQLALLHENEAVIPAAMSERLQNAAGDGSSGDVHHHWNISTMDVKGLQDFAKRNPSFFAAGVKNATRSGHLNPQELARGK